MSRDNYDPQSMSINDRSHYISPIIQQTLQQLPKIYGTIKKRILFKKEKFYQNMQKRGHHKDINKTEEEQNSSEFQQSQMFKKIRDVKVKDFKMRKEIEIHHQKNMKMLQPQLNRSISKNSHQFNRKKNDHESSHKVKFNSLNFVLPQQNMRLFISDKDHFSKLMKQKNKKQGKALNLAFSKKSQNSKYSKSQNKEVMTQQIKEQSIQKEQSYKLMKKHYIPKIFTNKINKSLQSKKLSLKTNVNNDKDQYQRSKRVASSAQTEFSRRLKPINNKSTDISNNENTKYAIPAKDQYKQYIQNYQPINPDFDLKQLIYKKAFQIIPYKDSVYFGEVEGQIKKGMAVFVTQQSIFEGIYQNDQKLRGYEKNVDGIYKGFFKEGAREGPGLFQWHNGQIFEGQWKSGKKHGKGIWISPAGDSYQGQWINGRQHGNGVHKHKNSTYQGQFINGLKHGNGEQIFSNGDKYKGFYENGKPNGYGRYDWSDGSYYEGEFQKGYREGKGILKEANGTYYKVKALSSLILNTGLAYKCKNLVKNLKENSTMDHESQRDSTKTKFDVLFVLQQLRLIIIIFYPFFNFDDNKIILKIVKNIRNSEYQLLKYMSQ